MRDEDIKKLLSDYLEVEMSFIDERKYLKYDCDKSKRFSRRIRRLFSTEKYFGRRIIVGYVTRWIAVLILSFVILAGINQVSAQIFGFNPWKYITSYLSDVRMEKRTFTGKNQVSSEDANQILTAKNIVPTYIPDGIDETEREINDDMSYVIWSESNEELFVSYQRSKIVEGEVILTDAEYDTSEKCIIGGYTANYYIKKNEKWLDWSDQKYHYHIFTNDSILTKEELLEMAKSIYD